MFVKSQKEIQGQVDSLYQVLSTKKINLSFIEELVAWDDAIYIESPELSFRINSVIDSLTTEEEKYRKYGIQKDSLTKYQVFSKMNIGSEYSYQGKYKIALSYYKQALKLAEKSSDKHSQAAALNNIANIYADQKFNDEALRYYQMSYDLLIELKNELDAASLLNNMGVIYMSQARFELAEEVFNESLEIRERKNDLFGVATSKGNLGNLETNKKNFAGAENIYQSALEIYENLGAVEDIAHISNNLGELYQAQNLYRKAITSFSKGLKLSQQADYAIEEMIAYNGLYTNYRNLGEKSKALDYYEAYVSLKDSIYAEESREEFIRAKYQLEYEKQAAADSIKATEQSKLQEAKFLAEKAKKEKIASVAKARELENKQERQKSYFLLGGLGLALVFGFFIFNHFRITQKQKAIIEDQKKEVDMAYDQLEEKNTEILDSIAYAKRIQSAILPPQSVLKKELKDAFVFYKPKDIVAGDFYWLEPQKERVLFAAADCTGHGVPGAMVSVVCNNGLNRSVREFGLTDPGEILDKTRAIVISEFEKSEEDVKDGMDIALCSLSGVEGGSTQTLEYAGANNPLWIIRKDGKTVEEIKASKQPIGKYTNPQPYVTHKIELDKGDSIYIFSDGYADQFGGDKGKKLKSKNFKELLLSMQGEEMERQKQLLDEAFDEWKGDYEQLDDVCVIGVKI